MVKMIFEKEDLTFSVNLPDEPFSFMELFQFILRENLLNYNPSKDELSIRTDFEGRLNISIKKDNSV